MNSPSNLRHLTFFQIYSIRYIFIKNNLPFISSNFLLLPSGFDVTPTYEWSPNLKDAVFFLLLIIFSFSSIIYLSCFILREFYVHVIHRLFKIIYSAFNHNIFLYRKKYLKIKKSCHLRYFLILNIN